MVRRFRRGAHALIRLSRAIETRLVQRRRRFAEVPAVAPCGAALASGDRAERAPRTLGQVATVADTGVGPQLQRGREVDGGVHPRGFALCLARAGVCLGRGVGRPGLCRGGCGVVACGWSVWLS